MSPHNGLLSPVFRFRVFGYCYPEVDTSGVELRESSVYLIRQTTGNLGTWNGAIRASGPTPSRRVSEPACEPKMASFCSFKGPCYLLRPSRGGGGDSYKSGKKSHRLKGSDFNPDIYKSGRGVVVINQVHLATFVSFYTALFRVAIAY